MPGRSGLPGRRTSVCAVGSLSTRSIELFEGPIMTVRIDTSALPAGYFRFSIFRIRSKRSAESVGSRRGPKGIIISRSRRLGVPGLAGPTRTSGDELRAAAHDDQRANEARSGAGVRCMRVDEITEATTF